MGIVLTLINKSNMEKSKWIKVEEKFDSIDTKIILIRIKTKAGCRKELIDRMLYDLQAGVFSLMDFVKPSK